MLHRPSCVAHNDTGVVSCTLGVTSLELANGFSCFVVDIVIAK